VGTWFPGFRKAGPEQVRAFRSACVALWRNPDRTETPRYLDLNDRVIAAEQPLGRAQRLYHFHGAINDMSRLEAQERRAGRAARRTRARRGTR
jgi:hypothetical protein